MIAQSGPALAARRESAGRRRLPEVTDEHIRQVLAKTARLEEAAEILGIDVATLYRRRRKWQAETSEGG